jgi:glycosyltransferase involved in cell wall biosynthesis
MRVAYVTVEDPRDPLAWSGTNRRIAEALEAQGVDLYHVGPLRRAWAPLFKAKHAWHKLTDRPYARDREPAIARGYARQVLERLRGEQVDAVFSPGSIAVSMLNCPWPIVTWSDATFAGMLDYYPDFTDLPRGSVDRGLALEREAVGRIAMMIFASQWAADSAVRHYGADPARVRVVPFGASVVDPPTADAVAAAVAARPTDRCRLLFIGVDFTRKGGPVAVEAARAMNDAGVPTELSVVGAAPTGPLPDFVRPVGFVNKFTPAGRQAFDRLLSEAHFLLLPSRAEAYGLAPCEANAYGVPALASATGGLTEIVRPGRNGFTFPLDAPGRRYAERMLELLARPDEYRALCAAARGEYKTRLNWGAAGRGVRAILDEVVAGPGG